MTDDYVEPVEEYGTDIPPIEEPQSKNRIWIILIVVLVALCCCCVVVSAVVMYQWGGDMLMENLGLYTLAPLLLP